MNSVDCKKFVAEFEGLYRRGQRMEAVELMRNFFTDYNGKNSEIDGCLLQMAHLSENWKSENTAEAYYINAYAKSWTNAHDDILKNAFKAIELNPELKYTYHLIGNVYKKLKEYPKAIEYYNKAIQLDPDSIYSYNALGIVYYNLKEYPKAIKYYNKAIQLDPDFQYPYNWLGNVYDQLKEYSKAIEYYNKAIQLDPNDVYPNDGLGNVYHNLKEYPKAIEHYSKAIQLDSNYFQPYNGLGNVYYNLKEYPKAIEYYNKAIRLDPGNIYSYNGLGIVHKALEDYQKAIEYFDKVTEIDPGFEDVYYNRANTYYLLDKYDNAIADYEQYIILTTRDPDIYTSWAKDRVEELKTKVEYKEFEEADKIIGQIKEILRFRNKCITHYTGISTGSKLIINSSKLRLSEGSFLNDTSEGRQLFELLDWHIEPTHKDETLSEAYTEKPFIGSFVADHEHNNLTLWRMYGKEQQAEAKGCAITVDKDKLVEEIKKALGINKKVGGSLMSDDIFTFYNVAYRSSNNVLTIPGAKKNQNANLNKLIMELKNKLAAIPSEKRESKAGRLITESLNNIAYLFKTAEYQYEHEVRLVIKDITDFKKTIDVNFNPPRVYLELTSILPAITKVTLGPKVERPDEWAAAFNYTFKELGLQPGIIISRLPYK